MNPNVDSSPGMRLPEPLPAPRGTGVEQAPAMESQPGSLPPGSSAANQMPPLMPSVVPAPAPVPAPPLPVTNTQSSGPAVADDGDTIEKEWVLKAKQIVAATSSDPYQQNRQLAAFKADYLQKRYNKTVKLSE